MQSRMLRRAEFRDERRKQRFDIALDVVEVAGPALQPPLLVAGVAVGDPPYFHRLAVRSRCFRHEAATDLEQPGADLLAADIVD
ncbi:hypothetical protein D3C83_35370 [compost metagenome]